MRKFTLILALAAGLVSCKKDKAIQEYLPGSLVEFKEKQKPGFGLNTQWVMPLKVRGVLGRGEDYIFYLTTDINGDTCKVYNSSIKTWLK